MSHNKINLWRRNFSLFRVRFILSMSRRIFIHKINENPAKLKSFKVSPGWEGGKQQSGLFVVSRIFPPPKETITWQTTVTERLGLQLRSTMYLTLDWAFQLFPKAVIYDEWRNDEILTSFTLGEKFNNLSTPHGLSACSNNACSLLIWCPGNTEDLARGAGESINRRLSPMLACTMQTNT